MSSHHHYNLKTITCSIIFLCCLLDFQVSNAIKSGYWSPENGLQASDIDSTLFTHLLCAFAHLDTQTYQVTTSSECSTFPHDIKQKNPSVKAILSIGGSPSYFQTMASQPSSRKTFIDTSINLAMDNGYDGLDLDWEQQLTTDDMDSLATLLNEWRAAIKASSSSLLLTAALRFTAKAYTGVPLPAQAIAQNLDWVNLMAYDFYAPDWSPKPLVTRPHAALHDPPSITSGSSGVNAWINAGVPGNKLVLGVPFYGYAWKLVNPSDHGILAPSSGEDKSIGDGMPTYKQIKDFVRQNGAAVVYNSSYVTNYCYSGTTWIVYDDLETIKAKVAYAKNTKLLGYFAWNIVQDSDWALSKQAFETWGA